MRLIRIEADGSLSLVQYIDNKPIPPYGILSHTWLLARDEVTFKDMQEGRGVEKKGYAKITFCAKQAQRDRLRYFWVDTCCIDKSQGPELDEAINSMYRWYQQANQCYVYLTDVRGGTLRSSTAEHAIRRSRWFKRGWTLQELLAPPVVRFYSESGDFLGDRSSLCELIAQCTKLPVSALTGKALSTFDIDTRLSWMDGRRTTKPEDKVYALLGIAGVVMTPKYGIGYENALARFKRKMWRSPSFSEENGQKVKNLEKRLQLLQTQMRKKSWELGFPGCGSFGERVRVDDGLSAPYHVPLEWCRAPEDFYNFLEFKFRAEQLPGLPLIERGHILIWDWNETAEIGYGSWKFATMHQRALKVSFVMGACFGPPPKRCMRCRKPRPTGIKTMVINECRSCHLAVRWVEPDYLPYEPEDQSLIFDKDMYRNHRANIQVPSAKERKRPFDKSKPKPGSEPSNTAMQPPPPIELVCRRLTMKFEPIHNIVVRYSLCRCVMWRATPSNIIPEMTWLRDAQCPRHNTTGRQYRDYGGISIPCHEDPYFEQFGGYNLFWALLHRRFPGIFKELNGNSAVSRLELIEGHIGYLENDRERPLWSQDLAEDYWFEIVDTWRTLPVEIEGEYLRIKTRRAERGIDGIPRRKEPNDDQIGKFRNYFSKSTMGRELQEITEGRWTGEPHWIF